MNMKRILTIFLLLASFIVSAQSTTVVISQVYGGGGNSGAPLNADYIELHNVSSSPVSLSGYSVQYASAAATSTTNWITAILPSATIPAGGYYLIQTTAAGTNGSALSPDVTLTTTTLSMGGTAGRVALVNGTTPLVGCPTSGSYIDLVGYGSTATCYEGTGPTPAPSNTTAIFRGNNGCTDTDNNASDFSAGTPAPRNASSTVFTCGGAASPLLTPTPSSLSFTSTTVGTQSASQSISLVGANLTGAPGSITLSASSSDFQVSTDNANFSGSTTISYTGASLSATNFYVRFSPQASGARTGSINLAGGGATSSVNVSGTGVALSAPVATAGTTVSGTGFTANWNAVTGATGYFLDVYTQSTGTVTSTIAGWPFTVNTSASMTASEGNANNINSQTLSAVGPTGTVSNTSAGPSSTTNPYSASTNGWNGGANTNHWLVNVNTTGITDVKVSSSQLASNTGPANFKLQYKVGTSGNWTDIANGAVTITASNVWANLSDIPLPSDANNQSLVSLRWLQTSEVSVNGATVASTGTSRISAIYIKGSVSGTVNNYVLQNQNVGNVTSYAVSSLTPATTYYYVVRAANAVTTSANSNEITVATVASTPTLSTTALTAFGNSCLNTTAGPNSFTITGSNLSSGDITVATLAGFSYSTTATGTYTSTLTIPNTGGSLTQEVFVKFTPTAVQSYNGAILISGGGVTAAVQVAASGAGVNTLASVTTGASSNLTQTGATLAGAITANGCGTVTAYGIEYSTTNGFANGAGTQVTSSNLSSGNFTAALSSLSAGTTYYYKAYATTGAGTAYGSQQSFTTVSPNPVLSASALTAFGNACINTTSSANTFTITGTNLSNANVEVAALSGYTYSLTSGGTYTSTLSIAQSGGAFSQQVFVKFTPTAVQSYVGNIAITGGGVSTAVNVAASGTGVNTTATVSTGNSSAITVSAATLAGSISSNGCSSVTAYGIEYSTTNGFANGAGTRVASTNLSAGAFTSSLTGLTAATTYYYKAYATNSGGTSYGAQQSFTTSAPPPPAITLSTLSTFSNTCVGSFAGPNSFTITGANLTTALITVGPLNGFTFSQTPTGSFSDVIGILQTGGSQAITVYVRFTPTAAQTYSGNIPVNGGGATTTGVAASGVGVNTPGSITTGAATGITTSEVTLSATFNNDGCSAVTGYGIEYSSVNGFANGTGTRIVGTGAVAGNFSTTVSGLVPGATYYYKGYVTTNGAVNYGVQRSFTMANLGNKFSVFPSPVLRGSGVRITKASLTPGNYTAQFFNQNGQLVFQQPFNVQSTYINQVVMLPATMPFGLYKVVLANQDQQIETITILVQ